MHQNSIKITDASLQTYNDLTFGGCWMDDFVITRCDYHIQHYADILKRGPGYEEVAKCIARRLELIQ
uniref:CdiI_4 domain-containing protein n=1 Tax=Meloidogyne hapla TaxID=6305 RepID=A0A1I8BXJ3_MELHA